MDLRSEINVIYPANNIELDFYAKKIEIGI